MMLAVVVAAVWGLNFVVIAVGLDTMPPLLFVALRFGACAIPAVFFVGRPTVALRWVVAVAVSLAVVKFSLLFAGMAAGMPAGVSALVLQSQAVFTAVFAVLLLGERPSGRGVAGMVLACGGLVLVGLGSSVGPLSGFLLVLAAGAAWGVANVAMRKAAATDLLNFMVWVSVVATPVLIVLSLAVEGPSVVWTEVRSLSLVAVGAVAYVAYLSTLFAFGVWAALLRRYGAATVAPFAMLAPVFALLSAAILLGERLTGAELAGGGAVLVGVLLGAGRRRAAGTVAVLGGEEVSACVDGSRGDHAAATSPGSAGPRGPARIRATAGGPAA